MNTENEKVAGEATPTCPHCGQKFADLLEALKHKCTAPKPTPKSLEEMQVMIQKLDQEDLGR